MRKSTLFSIKVIKRATSSNKIEVNLLVEIPKTVSIYIITLYNNTALYVTSPKYILYERLNT